MIAATPISALLHASTMIVAGVYLLLRIPIISSPFLIFFILLSIFFSSFCAICQFDIKAIIAYSTSSQLAYMFLALFILNPYSSLFHLISHAFYKALLFLLAGIIIHTFYNHQDYRKMGSLLFIMPLHYIFFLISSLSLISFPFLSGFYSKENILLFSSSHSFNTFFFSSFSSFFSSFYISFLLYSLYFSPANSPSLFFIPFLPKTPYSLYFLLFSLLFFSIFFGFFFNLYTPLSSFFFPNLFHSLLPIYFMFFGLISPFLFPFLLQSYSSLSFLFHSLFIFFSRKAFFEPLFNSFFLSLSLPSLLPFSFPSFFDFLLPLFRSFYSLFFFTSFFFTIPFLFPFFFFFFSNFLLFILF